MPVSTAQLRQALDIVEKATAELVRDGTFHHGALTRLRQIQWPSDTKELAKKIAKKASTLKVSPNGAGMNGVTLDQRGRASLEALVLHYEAQSHGLFPDKAVRAIRSKLAAHHGPKFHGSWP